MQHVKWIGLAMAVAFCAGAVTGIAVVGGKAGAASAELPASIFSPGNTVEGPEASYVIEAVEGGWMRARLYRSLDGLDAPADEARWICVSGGPGPWALLEKGTGTP